MRSEERPGCWGVVLGRESGDHSATEALPLRQAVWALVEVVGNQPDLWEGTFAAKALIGRVREEAMGPGLILARKGGPHPMGGPARGVPPRRRSSKGPNSPTQRDPTSTLSPGKSAAAAVQKSHRLFLQKDEHEIFVARLSPLRKRNPAQPYPHPCTPMITSHLQPRLVAVLVAWALVSPRVTQAQENQPREVSLEHRGYAEKGAASLKQRWSDYARRPKGRKGTSSGVVADNGPTNREFATNSTAAYVEPDVLRSTNGLLQLTLNAEYASFKIGNDPVWLRTFNPGDKPSGKLVGPTLIVHPGDTLRIRLNNRLPAENWHPNMMNTLNLFNTLNIHYHGLHVSPNGISDNVLIAVGPQQSQDYEVKIPANHTTGTYWYHPHRHGSTAGDVASGMSGALIIEAKPGQNGLDNVSEVKAAKQRVMVLNQIPYIYNNSFPTPLPAKEFNLKTNGVVEEAYSGYIFGPRDWRALNRFTTINGVQLPRIEMRPGQVERWRLVDSGQREELNLRIVPAGDTKAASAVPFWEVAVDGLTTGRIAATNVLELWPGYRSDVLVKAPAAGEYHLADGTEPVTYVARISVSGEPMDMSLPSPKTLAPLGQTNIPDKDVTGQQKASYGIKIVGGNTVFTIDGKSFDMETARRLYLNDVDEWTIESDNDVGPVTHPFHIHVNPFEVTSIMAPLKDASGNPVMTNGTVKLVEQLPMTPDGKTIHVWRDTVKIPGGGRVTMRTRYTDFLGTFVQHCHILDHEDQGMMQLIDIQPAENKPKDQGASLNRRTGTVAADFALPDAEGTMHTLAEVRGSPAVVFLFKGHGCLHCAQQVTAFSEHYREFQRKGIHVIGITSDTVADLSAALKSSPCPFTLLSDPKGVAFQDYGCASGVGLRHGTFRLDAEHKITWSTIGASPFIAVTELLKDPPEQDPTPPATSPALNQASVRLP